MSDVYVKDSHNPAKLIMSDIDNEDDADYNKEMKILNVYR